MKFPKKIYVKLEGAKGDEYLSAQETPEGIVGSDESCKVAIYQLLEVKTATAPTTLK